MARGEIKALLFAEGVDVTAPTALQLSRSVSIAFSGSESTKTIDVSAYVPDARSTQWTLKKPLGGTTNGEQIMAKITTPDESSVVIDTGDFPLPAGTYILLGA